MDLEYPDLDSYDQPPPVKDPEPVSYPSIGNDANSNANNQSMPKQSQVRMKPTVDRSVKPVISINKDIDDKFEYIGNEFSVSDVDHVATPSIPKIIMPDIRRELKPKVIWESLEETNESDDIQINKYPTKDEDNKSEEENPSIIEKFRDLDESLKKAEQEKLKLKEEDNRMKLKMEGISKEAELLKIKEDELEETLRENEKEKLELENKR